MTGFWLQVLAEALASLPVFLVGLWISHRKLREHVDKVTRTQTGDFEEITAAQTAQLESSRRA